MSKDKTQKKKLKAQVKAAKKRSEIPTQTSSKWYKNPDWIRAIAAIVSIVIAILGLLWIR